MDTALRQHYLDAMGITRWLPRHESSASLALDSEIQISATEPSIVDDAPSNSPVDIEHAWQTLEAEVSHCYNCVLSQTRLHTVFGSGNRHADWMFIGEGPGQHEDEQGLPFVGPAGLLLTEMIRALGLNREHVYIANIIKCRPPKNRDPHVDEIAACSHFLKRQIELVNPKIILAVGRIAAQTLLDTEQSVSKLRGQIHRLNEVPLIVVYHPAYLLRSLPEKRKAWQDLQLALKTITTE